MTSKHLGRSIEELFEVAITLDESELAGFVHGACGDDAELERQLFSLLLEHTDGALAPDAEDLVGTTIDEYALDSLIGQGSLGAVYGTTREAIDRPVALKVLMRADTLAVSAFQREAALLASLEHPSVVSIVDRGTSNEGREYLVMQLVRGVPLDAIIDSLHGKRRSDTPPVTGWELQSALRVLIRVAEAMEYAHRAGVVHRDLKPVHIRVEHNNHPVVIDWGLAQRVALPRITPNGKDRSSSHGRSGMSGEPIGTIAYMAPEQARGDEVAMGASADIYSLGAILYQLLTGTPPVEFQTDSSNPRRAALDQVQSGRRTPVRVANPRVHRDLAAVCEKAMAGDPSERYPSMDALALDVRNYLELQPVKARWSRAQVTWKFCRRHTGLLAAGLLGLVGVVGVQSWSNRELIAKDRDLVVERDDKENALRLAEENLLWVQGLFALGSQLGQTRPGPRLETVLDKAASDLGWTPEDDDHSWYRHHLIVGDGYLSISAYDKATVHLELAHEGLLSLFGEHHAEVGLSLVSLAQLRSEDGQSMEAVRIFEKGLPILARWHGEDSLMYAEALYQNCVALQRANESEAAIEMLAKFQSVSRRSGRWTDRLEVLGGLDTAVALHGMGRISEGLERVSEASALMEAKGLDDDDLLAELMYVRGLLLTSDGRGSEAIVHLDQSLRLRSGVQYETHSRLISTLFNLGIAHSSAKRFDQALEFMDRAAAASLKKNGRGAQFTQSILVERALVLDKWGRSEEARAALAGVVEVCEEVGAGLGRPSLRAQVLQLRFMLDDDDAGGAIALARELVPKVETEFGEHHLETRFALEAHARALELTGETAEAMRRAKRSVAGLLGGELEEEAELDEVSGTCCATYAELLNSEARFEEALPYAEHAARALEHAYGPLASATLNIQRGCGELYYRLGRLEKAEQVLAKVYSGWAQQAEKSPESYILSAHDLGAVRVRLGHFAAARPLLEQVSATRRETLGLAHWWTIRTENLLAICELEAGELSAAAERYRGCLRAALELVERSPTDHVRSLIGAGRVELARNDREKA